MNDDQHNTPQPAEQISLTDLYQALPEHIANTEEPFDVEAGLAELNAWIDEQPGTQAIAEQDREPFAAGELVSSRLAGDVDRSLEMAHALTPELAARWLDQEERRIAIEERRIKLERKRLELRHDLDLQRLQSERTIDEERLALRRQLLGEEARLMSRGRAGRAVARVLAPVFVMVGFVLSAVYHVGELATTLSLAAALYGLLLFTAVTAATRAGDVARRRDARDVLRALLLQDRDLRSSRDDAPLG